MTMQRINTHSTGGPERRNNDAPDLFFHSAHGA